VIERKIGWIASRFAGMSTALKMLLYLSLGLFPLGLIAILASIQSASESSREQREEISARVQLKAQRLNSAIARIELTTQAASAVIGLTAGDGDACRAALKRFERDQPLFGRYAFYAAGNSLACASPDFRPPAALAERRTGDTLVEISEDKRALRYARFGENGDLEGYWEVPREVLARIADLPSANAKDDLELRSGNQSVMLRNGFQGGALIRTLEASAPIGPATASSLFPRWRRPPRRSRSSAAPSTK
jgi:hypothetical protein